VKANDIVKEKEENVLREERKSGNELVL